MGEGKFSHLDKDGSANMVDISEKNIISNNICIVKSKYHININICIVKSK